MNVSAVALRANPIYSDLVRLADTKDGDNTSVLGVPRMGSDCESMAVSGGQNIPSASWPTGRVSTPFVGEGGVDRGYEDRPSSAGGHKNG